jgi:hypothetical protein
MNTWQAFTAGSLALVVLHSVPPLVVFVATEAVTDLRDKLGQAANATFMNDAKPEPRAATGTTRRTSFDEYMSQARAAWRPDVTVTPAWVREVTGCSRGLSSRLAAAFTAGDVPS